LTKGLVHVTGTQRPVPLWDWSAASARSSPTGVGCSRATSRAGGQCSRPCSRSPWGSRPRLTTGGADAIDSSVQSHWIAWWKA
jgi:hypothetical protein